MRALLVMSFLGLSSATAVPAMADEIPQCAVIRGAVDAVYPTAVPSALVARLQRDLSPFALPGERFDASDIRITGISRRLIWIRHLGSRWVVAWESGGIGYNDQVAAFDLANSGAVKAIGQGYAFPPTVCAVTNRWLTAPPKPD